MIARFLLYFWYLLHAKITKNTVYQGLLMSKLSLYSWVWIWLYEWWSCKTLSFIVIIAVLFKTLKFDFWFVWGAWLWPCSCEWEFSGIPFYTLKIKWKINIFCMKINYKWSVFTILRRIWPIQWSMTSSR